MKRFLTILVVAIASLLVYSAIAIAHTPQVWDDCSGLYVRLTQYEGTSGPAQNNTVTVTIDGVAEVFSFDNSYSGDFSWSQTADHTWTVAIDANLNNGNPTQYDRTFNGSEQACQPTTTTTTTSTSTTVPLPLPSTTSTSTTPAPTTTVPVSTTSSTVPPSSPSSTSTVPDSTSTTTPQPVSSTTTTTVMPLTTTTGPTSSSKLPVTGPSLGPDFMAWAFASICIGGLLVLCAKRSV